MPRSRTPLLYLTCLFLSRFFIRNQKSKFQTLVGSLTLITSYQVAKDAEGRGMLEELEADGVDTSFVVVITCYVTWKF